ncbi:MAG: proline iminopeptidase-family hydrolase [Caulobacter sp.]|nr:proline iminopeptidase-family hydrolase [Caulobacter sp.]
MTNYTRRAALGLLAAVTAAPSLAQAAPTPLTAAPPPDQELMVPVPGGRVYVRVNGDLKSRRPPLLMAHGGPGGSHAVNLPAIALAADRAVILYDQLDCGRSDAPGDPANWTVPRFVAEIDPIRQALGLERLHFLGHSWGGTLGLEYAARRPPGLASLILQGPLISTPVWLADAARLRASLPRPVQTELTRCDSLPGDSPGCETATEIFYNHFNTIERDPAWLTAYGKTLPKSFTPALYQALWGPNEFRSDGTLRTYDGTPLLPRIAAPTLILSGQFDAILPATARRFARLIPRGESQVIPGAAHAIQIDQPQRWLMAIDGWLRRFDS